MMDSSIVRSVLAIAIVMALGTGCQSPVSPDGVVTASISGLALRIENRTDEPVFYAPMEREMSSRVLLALCVTSSECPVIPPRSVAMVPLSDVDGLESASDVVVVHWWHRVSGPVVGYYQAGPVGVITVRRRAAVWDL